MPTKLAINLTRQPVYLNFSDKRTLKIPARDSAEVAEADLNCPDLLFHRSRGDIVILDKAEQS